MNKNCTDFTGTFSVCSTVLGGEVPLALCYQKEEEWLGDKVVTKAVVLNLLLDLRYALIHPENASSSHPLIY